MIFALLSALAWSLLDLLRKYLSSQTTPLSLAVWLALGVTPLYAVSWVASGSAMPESDYWLPGSLSVLAAAVASFSFIKALSIGRMAILIPVLSFTPVVAAILSWVLLGDIPDNVQLAAMAVIVVTIFVLNGGWNLLRDPTHAGPGFGLMLLVSLCWGMVIVLDKWALASAPLAFHGFLQSAGMVLLLCLELAVRPGEQRRVMGVPVYQGHIGLLMLAVVTFATAVSLQWLALAHVHAGVLETIKRGTGILGAALWGAWLFREQVGRIQLLLMVVIIAATALLSLS